LLLLYIMLLDYLIIGKGDLLLLLLLLWHLYELKGLLLLRDNVPILVNVLNYLLRDALLACQTLNHCLGN